MTQAGIVLGIISFSSFIGGIIGGAVTDRLGRRKPILFGLVFSALSSLTLGFANNFQILYPLAVLIGLLSDVGGPAHGAMIADILPRETAAGRLRHSESGRQHRVDHRPHHRRLRRKPLIPGRVHHGRGGQLHRGAAVLSLDA